MHVTNPCCLIIIYVLVFNAMYGFVICSCVYVFALVFLSKTGTGIVDIKLTAVLCMAGQILETE